VDTTNAPKAAPAPVAAPTRAKGAKAKATSAKPTPAKPGATKAAVGKTKATKPIPDTAAAVDADETAAAPAGDAKNPFTLQVAAYTSRPEASALVAKLKKRSIDARVDPAGKLFRVRIGHYPTHDAAAAAAAALKARKIDAFISDTRKDIKK
jgi:cell division protein FtsN